MSSLRRFSNDIYEDDINFQNNIYSFLLSYYTVIILVVSWSIMTRSCMHLWSTTDFFIITMIHDNF